MIVKEFFNKMRLFLYLKITGTERELKKLKINHDPDSIEIDDLDKLNVGVDLDDLGSPYSYVKPLPEKFWKYFKYKSKNYDDDIFRKKNLLFMGKIPPEERKKVIKQIAKSDAYKHKSKGIFRFLNLNLRGSK